MVVVGATGCSISWIVDIDVFGDALICIKYFTVSKIWRCISWRVGCGTDDVFFAIWGSVYLLLGIGPCCCVIKVVLYDIGKTLECI